MRVDEILAYLFEDGLNELKAPMITWLTESRRFALFVDTHRDKIRKKIRITREPEALQDLQHELETAYRLAREKQFSVTYEPYRSGGGRPFGPDFSVTYTTSFTFNVEATRLRDSFEPDQSPVALGKQEPPPVLQSAQQRLAARLSDATGNKLYQLMPAMINVIVIGVDHWALGLNESHIAAAMVRMKQRAESGDTTLFVRYGLRDAAEFFKHYERLSSIVVLPTRIHVPDISKPIHAVNRQGKHALPAKVVTLLRSWSTR